MSVEAVLKAVDANFTATMEQAVQSLGEVVNANSKMTSQVSSSNGQTEESSHRLTGGFMQMASAMGAVAIAAKAFDVVRDAVGGAVNRFDTLNNSTRTFNNMGFGVQEVSQTMNGLKQSILGLPTPLDQAVKGVQMIAASTGDLSKSQKVYSALNDSIIGFGGSTADVNNAVIQLSQAFANGKVDGMTWISMMNSNMGPVLNAVAKKMGMTTAQLKDGLSSGKISVQDFQNALIGLDKNGGGGLKSLHKIALDATSGIGTSMENAKTAIVRGLANVLTAINKGLSDNGLPTISEMIQNAGNSMAHVFERLAKVIPPAIAAIAPFIKACKPIAPLLKAIAVAFVGLGVIAMFSSKIAPAITVFSALGKAAKGVTSSLGGLLSKLNPFSSAGALKGIEVGIAIFGKLKSALSVGKAFIELVTDAKNLVGVFQNLSVLLGTNPWILLAAAIAAVIAALVYFFTQTKAGRAIWSGFVSFLVGLWNQLVTTVTTVWGNIVKVFTVAVGIIETAWSGTVTFFTTLWTGIVTVATTIWNMIVAVVQTVVTAMQADWQGFTTFLATLWTGIVTIATTVWNMIVSVVMTVVTAIQAVWSGFSSFMSEIWDGIVSVASSIWDSLVDIVSSVWNAITSVVSGAVSAVSSAISAGFNTARSIVSSVMNAMRAVISSVWNGIKSLFSAGVNFIKSVVHVDLSAEGRAIMNSFFNGLKSVWESIKSFVSGIAGWIKAHKGPISLDRKLLIPAGQAIMNGLNEGLTNGFENVQSNVSAMAGAISNAATVSVPPIQDSAFTKSISAVQDKMQNMSANVEGTITTNNAAMTNVTARMWQSRMEQMMGMAVDKLDNVNQHPVVTLDTANQLAEHSNKVNADLYHSWR